MPSKPFHKQKADFLMTRLILLSVNCRHYLQGDVLKEKIHHAISVVNDELKSQKEPTDPECYITFIVGFILMGVSYNIK